MAHLKITGPDAQDFGEPVASFLKVSSRGLIGWDRSVLIKRAGAEFVELARKIHFHPDEVPLHVIGLGSSESYGCFVAGTEVRMGDGSSKPIEQVELDDEVIDRWGRPGRVSTTYARPYDGPGRELTISGMLDNIVCTDKHKFLVIPAEQVVCQIDAAEHCKPGTCQVNAICQTRSCGRSEVSYQPVWRAANRLRQGDYALVKAPDRGVGKQTWAWNDAYAALAGYFLAEGSFIKEKGILVGLSFSFHAEEIATLASDVVRLAMSLHGDYADLLVNGPYLHKPDNSCSVRVLSRGLAGRMRREFGEYAAGKFLGGPVFAQRPDLLARLVATYFDGDGTNSPTAELNDPYPEARYSASTTSRQLALDLQWALTKLGVAASVCHVTPREENHAVGYRVSWCNSAGEFMRDLAVKHRDQPPLQFKQHSFSWNGFIARPIRAVKTKRLRCPVYNLEVLDDHSYTVGNGVVVKNCNRNADGFKEATLIDWHHTFEKLAKVYQHHKNKDPLKSYGVVKLSFYNPIMRRVELLLGLNKTAEAARRNAGLVDEDFVNDVESGKPIAVSMACKIAYDVCAICDNKAPTRDDYCESVKEGGSCPGFGCLNGLTRVLDDGRVQHVDNPKPRFFDISRVRRPADRIAYGGLADYLTKAAAARHNIGGAELAEALGLETPAWLLGDEPNIDTTRLVKLAHELAALETDVERRIAAGDTASSNYSRIDVSQLGQPGSPESLEKLAALSRLKIALSPTEFATWICGAPSDERELGLLGNLPGLYGRLTKCADFATWISDNVYRHVDKTPGQRARQWAEQWADSALTGGDVVRRTMRKMAADDGVRKPRYASPSVFGGRLAEQYAAYKLAFLETQLETSPTELPLTAWFAVRQNYDW